MYKLVRQRHTTVAKAEKDGTVQAREPRSATAVRIRPRRNWILGRTLAFSMDDNSIQMAAVDHLGRRRKIRHLEKIYIPSSDSGRADSEVFISKTIDSFVREHGGRGVRISLAVSGRETAYRIFFMPVMRKRDLRSAIALELGRQVPFPVAECFHNYRTVFKIGSREQQRYRVALLAATRRFLNERLKPFHELGLEVSNVYLTQDVAGSLLEQLPDFSNDRYYTLVHIKRHDSEISFYKGSCLEFFNTLSTGSAMLDGGRDTTRFGFFAESLATEIQTSLDYYTGQYSRNFANKIYIYGDLSYGDEVAELLNSPTGFAFQNFPAHRLSHISVDEKNAEVLAVCLPALAAGACQVELTSLLPTVDRRRLVAKKIELATRGGLVFLSMLIFANWYMLSTRTEIYQAGLNELRRQEQVFKNSEAFYTYNVLKRQIAADRNYLELTRESPSYLHLSLKELSRLTPPPIELLRLDFNRNSDGRNLTIQGVATGRDIPPEVILAEYVETLVASPFYSDVTVVRHNKKQDAGKFTIEFVLDMRGVL